MSVSIHEAEFSVGYLTKKKYCQVQSLRDLMSLAAFCYIRSVGIIEKASNIQYFSFLSKF